MIRFSKERIKNNVKNSKLTLFWLFSSFGTSFNLGGGVLGSMGGRDGGEFDTLRFLMGGGIGGGVIFVELWKFKVKIY